MSFRPFLLFSILLLSVGVSASQTPMASPVPTPRVSDQLSKVLEAMKPDTATPREQKEKAYAKLLEGQRYIWSGDRLRSAVGRQNNVRLAKQAFRESVELDPFLSEGYTALAELAINGQPQDAEEAIRLALLAVKVNPNNFGAHRILGRLYSFQSRVGSGTFQPEPGRKAIEEWKHVVRLDPRNAEAWALLSELYEKTGQTDASIDALKRWLSAATPLETRFYQMLMGGANLAPENASLKLANAYMKTGRTKDAIEVISMLIADDPGNSGAVELLRETVESATPESAAIAAESLKQAIYTSPENMTLVSLLAQMQARAGKLGEATILLRETSTKLLVTDRTSASLLLVNLGDLMARADKPLEAVAEYEAALIARGLLPGSQLADDDREFVVHVFGRMIQTLKSANRVAEAKAVIERARKMLGSSDLFADRELISLLRETGNRTEALTAVKAVRTRMPNDYGFTRLEATLLTETGRVDEGVALIKRLMEGTATPRPVTTMIPGSGESVSIAVPASDAFSNWLFISSLYTQANRGKDAVAAANQAHAVARGAERKQIARLTLATAQQMSGDFAAAEATLRDLLKETPGNPIALNNLGYFLVERNERLEEALGLIQQALKIDPTNPSYLDSLGWAYFKMGKLAEAELHLKEALRFDASSGTIHEHLGDVYEKQGKLDLAKSSWTRAASLFTEAGDVTRVKKKLVSGK